MRQICIAAMMYGNENKGLWPPAALTDASFSNLHRWHGTRATSTPANTPFDFVGSATTGEGSPLKPYMKSGKVKTCPSFEPAGDGFESSAGGYGYNNYYLGSSTADDGWTFAWQSSVRTAKQAQVKRSSEKIAFADAAFVNPGLIEYSYLEPPVTYYTTFGPYDNTPSIHFRHRGRANIAWADGHVTAEKYEWTVPTNYYGGNNKAALIGWFGPHDNTLFQRN